MTNKTEQKYYFSMSIGRSVVLLCVVATRQLIRKAKKEKAIEEDNNNKNAEDEIETI